MECQCDISNLWYKFVQNIFAIVLCSLLSISILTRGLTNRQWVGQILKAAFRMPSAIRIKITK